MNPAAYPIRWPRRLDEWRAAFDPQRPADPMKWLLGLSLVLTLALLVAFIATVSESVERGDRLRMAQRSGDWTSLHASFKGQGADAVRVNAVTAVNASNGGKAVTAVTTPIVNAPEPRT